MMLFEGDCEPFIYDSSDKKIYPSLDDKCKINYSKAKSPQWVEKNIDKEIYVKYVVPIVIRDISRVREYSLTSKLILRK
jgi:hypothetical protein